MVYSRYKAYETLPDEIKRQLVGLRAVHSSRQTFGETVITKIEKLLPEAIVGKPQFTNAQAAVQDTVHPVVIKHPLSGRKALFVNPSFTTHFEGQTFAESAELGRDDVLSLHALSQTILRKLILINLGGDAIIWGAESLDTFYMLRTMNLMMEQDIIGR